MMSDKVTAAPIAAHPAPPVKVPLAAWWMLTVLLVMLIMSFVDRYILAMLVQPIKADLGLTDFEVSLLLGPAFAICYAVASVPFGWAADRYPRRWVILLGVLIWSGATMAGGLARSFLPLFAARIAVGVGESALGPSAYSLLADQFPRERLATATAIYQTGSKFGGAIAFGLGGVIIAFAGFLVTHVALLADVQPWHLVLILVGAPGLLIAFLALTFTEPARQGALDKSVSNKAALGQFLRENRKALALLLTGFCLVSVCNNAVVQWVPTFMERRFGWTPLQYGPALAVVSLAAAAAAIIKGGAIDYLYGRGMRDVYLRFYVWLLIGSLPVAYATFLAPWPWLSMVCIGVLNLVALPYFLYVAAVIAQIAPNQLRGQLNAGFLAVLGVVGQGGGPMVVGFITTFVLKNDQAIAFSLAITVGVCLTAALVVLRLALEPVGMAIKKADGLAASPPAMAS